MNLDYPRTRQKKLLLILGAGSSIAAGMPGVADLDVWMRDNDGRRKGGRGDDPHTGNGRQALAGLVLSMPSEQLAIDGVNLGADKAKLIG